MKRWVEKGTVLDQAMLKVYGRIDGLMELVMDANPGLASAGPILLAARWVDFPDIEPPALTSEPERLWD